MVLEEPDVEDRVVGDEGALVLVQDLQGCTTPALPRDGPSLVEVPELYEPQALGARRKPTLFCVEGERSLPSLPYPPHHRCYIVGVLYEV